MEGLTRTLSQLADAHRSVLEKARAAQCTCPEAIQNLGVALEAHRTMLDCVPKPARAFLDDNVLAAIRADGAVIAENLAHLASMTASEPGSSDVETLAAALLKRIQLHLEWNDRAVFGPLRRFYLETAGSRLPNHAGDVLDRDPSSTGDEHDPDV